MGSSSTAGRGEVVPYRHRLEMYRGKGNEEAIEELRRFDTDVFAEGRSLMIWQVGTNAVFHKERYELNKGCSRDRCRFSAAAPPADRCAADRSAIRHGDARRS
jgi:hypothetical protein